MEFEDVITANIPSVAVVRKTKQEAVWDIKYELKLNRGIHEIGLEKFYLMYWTLNTGIYVQQVYEGTTLASISIDAMGSLVNIPNAESQSALFISTSVNRYCLYST